MYKLQTERGSKDIMKMFQYSEYNKRIAQDTITLFCDPRKR